MRVGRFPVAIWIFTGSPPLTLNIQPSLGIGLSCPLLNQVPRIPQRDSEVRGFTAYGVYPYLVHLTLLFQRAVFRFRQHPIGSFLPYGPTACCHARVLSDRGL
jgi:hypothetical protein